MDHDQVRPRADKYSHLDKIQQPEQLRTASQSELEALARDLRHFIVDQVSQTGGHLASNLGTVELTLALLHCFDFRQDRVIWDVGHQSYAYKILTGRRAQFGSLRQAGGLSGFPKRDESSYDSFDTGHSSTALSAALGMDRARRAQQLPGRVLAVVGDGAATGGLFYEALNNIEEEDRVLLILNDNQMSIDRNVGAMSRHLNRLRTSSSYRQIKRNSERFLDHLPLLGRPLIRCMSWLKRRLRLLGGAKSSYFDSLGLRYYGPIDGHDLAALTRSLHALQDFDGPAVLHICTQKGQGYDWAEQEPERYHGVSPFSIEEGLLPNPRGQERKLACNSFTDACGQELLKLAQREERLVAITAAMAQGTGLAPFAQAYPQRFFDVGIAEQHAVCMAAGMAAGGLKPVVCIYSTFLQRALDQVLHDVVLQQLPVVFCIDRAGLVGADGETHQGLYEQAYLSALPGLEVYQPCCYQALEDCLNYALFTAQGPVAIRYPRDKEQEELRELYCGQRRGQEQGAAKPPALVALHSSPAAGPGSGQGQKPSAPSYGILALGSSATEALELGRLLEARGHEVRAWAVQNLELDEDLVRIFDGLDELICIEELVRRGGYAEALTYALGQRAQRLAQAGELEIKLPRVRRFGIPKQPVYQASSPAESRRLLGLDAQTIYRQLTEEDSL